MSEPLKSWEYGDPAATFEETNMTTATEIAMKVQPTIGEVAFQKAQGLAHIAAARALSRDWTEHPMRGIAVDTDQWALAYQAKLLELKSLLTPNAEVSRDHD